jgi:hypothetical protein
VNSESFHRADSLSLLQFLVFRAIGMHIRGRNMRRSGQCGSISLILATDSVNRGLCISSSMLAIAVLPDELGSFFFFVISTH